MKRLSLGNGTWQQVLDQWSKQSHQYEEDFESFLPQTLPMLETQIRDCEGNQTTGVYSHLGGTDDHKAICFLNGAFIPGFTGRVLRVRHLILAPEYDFGEYTGDEYAALLAAIFEDVLGVSDAEIPCKNVKMHFRSPADVALFREFATNLNEGSRFLSVKMQGAWLSISKI